MSKEDYHKQITFIPEMHFSFEIPNSFIEDFDFNSPRINSEKDKIETDRSNKYLERQTIPLEKIESEKINSKNFEKNKNLKNCIEYKWENITVRTKTKKKEKVILDNISGSVKTGEALAIIGGSGAGNKNKNKIKI
jgi:ABC-type glutathione transport system ATPase component